MYSLQTCNSPWGFLLLFVQAALGWNIENILGVTAARLPWQSTDRMDLRWTGKDNLQVHQYSKFCSIHSNFVASCKSFAKSFRKEMAMFWTELTDGSRESVICLVGVELCMLDCRNTHV